MAKKRFVDLIAALDDLLRCPVCLPDPEGIYEPFRCALMVGHRGVHRVGGQNSWATEDKDDN